MQAPPIPPDEHERLVELRAYGVLDTPPEATCDALTSLAAKLLGMPIALISLVDAERQWFKSRCGLDASETSREVSFCGHAVGADAVLEVPDALADPRFVDNPLVVGEPRVRFYAGVPLRSPRGFVLGTFCVIDRRPRRLAPEELALLGTFATQVVDQLELRRLALELRDDRNARLRAEAEARRSQEELRALLDGMAEGVVRQDATGAIVDCNPAAEEILGLTRDQMMGRTSMDPRWRSLRPDGTPFPGEEHPAMVCLRTGASQRGVLMRVQAPSFGERWISINAERLEAVEAGAAPGVVATFRDISEQVAVQAELRRSRELAAIQERLVTTGTLAAAVGHEINNPLSFVAGNLDIALERIGAIVGGSAPERMKELFDLLTDAREGADRIRRIVRGLQTFARDDSPLAPTDVRSAIDISIDMAMHELRRRATLRTELVEVPLAMADESRLSQVLVNLVVNAAQSFEEQSPEKNTVTIRTAPRGSDVVVIEVEDDGPGIAPEVLPRIFDPFFTTKPIGVGTGLGLAISQSLVQALGGALELDTELGRGTRFRVVLPVAPPAVADPGDRTEQEPGKSGRVLVIDDEQIVVRTIVRALETEHQVVSFTDPREALRALLDDEGFDLVICDMMMPGMTGAELYAAVHAARPRLATRFVFSTGGIITPEVQSFLGTVANERLDKPFRVQDVRALAARFTSRA